MTFSVDKNNLIPELSFIRIALTRDSDSSDYGGRLTGTFDFRKVGVETKHREFEVGFKSAWLTLEYEGFEPVLETRYGLRAYPMATKYQHKTTTGSAVTNETSTSVSGGFLGPAAKVAGQMGGKNGTTESNFKQVLFEEHVWCVETHGDQSWCFTGQNGGPLQGNLIPSVPIVELNHAQANRKHLRARVTVKQRDLWYDHIDGMGFIGEGFTKLSSRRHTQSKLAGILFAKALAKKTSVKKYSGSFIVSEATISDDSDESV